jgi:hypothetical protein
MKKETVTCDSCEKDISTTSNCEGWRLKLSNDKIPPRGPTVTLMAAWPPLDGDKYFCGSKCLSAWVSKREAK